MSDRTINYYEFPDQRPDWEKIKHDFKRNVSKFGVPFFEADSDVEREFVRYCDDSNLVFHKRTIIEYKGKGTETDRFLFLCLKDDNGACVTENNLGFLDLSAACSGGGAFGICGRGAIQVGKVPVRREGIKKVLDLDLVEASHPWVPKIWLLSPRLADVLQKASATGCEIEPCEVSECYQLRITAETLGATRIGHARMGKPCPVCGVAKMFIGSSERYFRTGDLKPTDFQICRLYAADNVGQFEIINGFPIVSQRIFDLLLGLKIKGLYRYTTDPPIQHAVVQVRG